ncbi:MAG TPA: futalosine hydrolase [Thermoanaerobaculia bacterium]|nr:futalosine hydrolase [Thermoanaerobaculia bacterium]
MTTDPSLPLALVCSVALEADPVRASLSDAAGLRVGGREAGRGTLGATPVLLLATGMGKTNAAQAVTALLERAPLRGVIGFGVGGAYPASGLQVGELALAEREIYGDEGVLTPAGWRSTEEIGIPLLERDGAPTFNDLPLDAERVEAARRALAAAGWRVRTGPFVTVSTCSGTAARGRELAERFGALCESMEGAAWAHVAAHYGVPFLELRAASNLVEDRDPSRWRLREAADAAARALPAVVGSWRDR